MTESHQISAASRLAQSKACRLGLAAILAGALALGCSPQDSPLSPTVPHSPEVTVVLAIETNLPLTLHARGHVSPFASVAVRSQVSGRLDRVHFKEGDKLRAGDLMFSIDSRPFATNLERAKSDLEKDLDAQKQAVIEQRQNAMLLQSKIVSEDTFKQSAACADSLSAAIAADRAGIASAQLELSFCEIHAPIDGRAGLLQLDPGNLIAAGEMVLVTVNQTDPVFIDFPLAEQNLPAVRRAISAGPLQVRAALPGDEQTCWTGGLTAVDNAVDPNSGTILLRARFENHDEALWPGQSVNVSLTLPALTRAVLTPRQAVQKGTNGDFVLVVNPDATIDSRPIETGDQLGAEIVIYHGLQSGDRVLLGQHDHLAPGNSVRIK